LRGIDAGQDFVNAKIGIVHATEDGVVERIETDRDARQTGTPEAAGFARQKCGIGGQGDIGCTTIRQAQCREHGDQLFDILA